MLYYFGNLGARRTDPIDPADERLVWKWCRLRPDIDWRHIGWDKRIWLAHLLEDGGTWPKGQATNAGYPPGEGPCATGNGGSVAVEKQGASGKVSTDPPEAASAKAQASIGPAGGVASGASRASAWFEDNWVWLAAGIGAILLLKNIGK